MCPATPLLLSSRSMYSPPTPRLTLSRAHTVSVQRHYSDPRRPASRLVSIGSAASLCRRAMPHTLRAIDGEDQTISRLEMIVGFDDDLVREATWVANRLHGLLIQIHPSLERVLGLGHRSRLNRLSRSAAARVPAGRAPPALCTPGRRAGWPPSCSARTPAPA
ncbi:transposase [Streptomyces gardneri]|uniref:IS110 family transposase n=1 Tax=Streptomyces gardneri TaxID=66892 RepID=UPI0036C22741